MFSLIFRVFHLVGFLLLFSRASPVLMALPLFVLLPSAELPASMDLDVVFLPIPIIKRKRVAWGLKRLEVKACQYKEPRIRVSSSSADSQAEMSPTNAISKHLEKEKAAKSCQAYKQHKTHRHCISCTGKSEYNYIQTLKKLIT